MDCDGFKQINDVHGHHAGDLVLRHISEQVLKLIRANDFFARFAGDEFCLILEGTTSKAALDIILSKILDAIATPLMVGEQSIRVTMSIGVAVYPKAGITSEVLLKHADKAMYAAKRHTKNKYVIYSSS